MRKSWLPLLAMTLLASAAFAGGSGEVSEARTLSQVGTKHALGETRLAEDRVSVLHAKIELAAASWARHVMKEGAQRARTEDLGAVIDEPLRLELQAEGIALSEQELILEAARMRAEATLVDFEQMVAAQARMKQACADSGLGDPGLSDLVMAARDWAEDVHSSVAVLGGTGEYRVPAIDLVKAEFLPVIVAADVPEMHRDVMLRALVDWLEARERIQAEADRGR